MKHRRTAARAMTAAAIIPLRELTAAQEHAWSELAARALEPNPFFEPDVVLPAHRHLGGRDVALVASFAGTEMVACMPVVRVSRWRRLPVPAIAAWRHDHCFLGTPLVASGRPIDALAALLTSLRRRSDGARLLALEWVGRSGPVADALDGALHEARLGSTTWRPFERPVLSADAANGETAPMSGHRRRNLHRLARRLEQRCDVRLAVNDRSDDRSFVERFLALEAGGWKGRHGTALGSLPGGAAFFREMAGRLGEAGRLKLLALEAGPTTIAMKCSVLANGAAFCFKSAYDESFARYSPGVLLEAEDVAAFGRDPRVAWMDSCTMPDNELIGRLWPGRRPLATTIVPPGRGVLGNAVAGGLRSALALDRRATAAST